MFEQHPRVVAEFQYWLELKGRSNTNATSTDWPTITDEPNIERDEAPTSPILPIIPESHMQPTQQQDESLPGPGEPVSGPSSRIPL